MGFDIGAITGALVLDTSKWDANLKKARADGKSFEGAVLNHSAAVQRMGLALAAAGAGILAMDAKLIRLASDVQLTRTLFNASFGSMGSAAEAWSEALSKAYTLNTDDTMKVLAQLNNISKGLNLSEQAAYDMSKSLTVLSLEMSRFFGISQEEAAGRLEMALMGATRGLRQLGIVIKETDIKNFALTHGIIQQGQELSVSQRALVTYSLLLEKTKFLQGSLSSSSQNLAALWSILRGQATQLGETLGSSLVPVWSSILRGTTGLIVAVNDLATRFPTLTSALVVGASAFGVLATAAGAVLLVLPGLATAAAGLGVTIGALAGGVALAFLQVAAAVAALVIAFQKFEFLKSVFYAFAQGVNQAFASMQLGLSRFFQQAAKISPVMKEQFEGLANSYAASSAQFAQDAAMMGQKAGEAYLAQERRDDEFKNHVGANLKGLKADFTDFWKGATDSAKNATDVMGKGDWLNRIQQQVSAFGALGQRVFSTLSENISSIAYDLTFNLSSFQEAAANFGKSLIRMLFEIAAQWLTLKIVMGLGFKSLSLGALGAGGTGAGAFSDVGRMGTSLPSFDTGIDYVPHDMIAKVHKGEEILRPEEARGSRKIALTVQNNIVSESVAAAMATREGQDVIVNTIRLDNARYGAIKREVSLR